MPPENDDIRSVLESVVEAQEIADDPDAQGTPEPVSEAPPKPPEPLESAPVESAPPETPVTPKAEKILEPKQPVVPPASEVVPPAVPGMEKAPGTWSPTAREQWAKVPAEVRSEVWKREKEASRAMTISSEARKFQNEFQNTIQPYLGFIAAENSTPLQAVNFMMQTAAVLRVGAPQQKVQAVAQIIKDFGIDLAALDTTLAGQVPEHNPQLAMQQAIQQQLAPVHQMLQQQQMNARQQDMALESEVATELEQFAAANEFYPDVKDTMADLMEVSQRRGTVMGLTEAYERATLLHEPVRRVIEARKQRQVVQKSTAAARQARQSSSSVTPSNEMAVTSSSAGDSVRASIEAAISAQQGR
jgi:hypothetical protein